MNNIKIKDFIKSNWLIIIIVGYIFIYVLKACRDDIVIENRGVMVSVTVENYDRVLFNKSGMKTVSRGFYYVDNKKYKCYNEKIIPIGLTFQIKYNPENPEVWRSIEE